MMYAFQSRTLAGLEGLEALMGMGQLPCCPAGQPSTTSHPCDSTCQTTEQIYYGGSGWSAGSCPAGIVDPSMVSLFGPCAVQMSPGGQPVVTYGGVQAGALPTPPATGSGSGSASSGAGSVGGLSWIMLALIGAVIVLAVKS